MTVTAGDHGTRDCTGAQAPVLSAELADVQEQAANLRAALASNRMIGMAVGRMVERWSMSPDTAFAVLRRYSQDSNRKLHDIAADLVATGQLPDLSLLDHSASADQ